MYILNLLDANFLSHLPIECVARQSSLEFYSKINMICRFTTYLISVCYNVEFTEILLLLKTKWNNTDVSWVQSHQRSIVIKNAVHYSPYLGTRKSTRNIVTASKCIIKSLFLFFFTNQKIKLACANGINLPTPFNFFGIIEIKKLV